VVSGVIHKKVGPDFLGETFRVLKEKEEREYGEYRTRRLVLEAWEAWGQVLQSSISKKIVVDIIPVGFIHKKVGPIVLSLSN
jgi:hypothetical protein